MVKKGNPRNRNANSEMGLEYYRHRDVQQVAEEMPAILESLERLNVLRIEPKLDERMKVRAFIKKFFSKHKLPMYGGTAVNDLVKHRNPKDAFYKDFNHGDLEAYSYDPLYHAKLLAVELHQQGFENVQETEAGHENTYKVYVNTVDYCDISYMPKILFNNLPTVKINGVIYADPIILEIDQQRIASQMITAAFRQKKNWERSVVLYNAYPYEKKVYPINDVKRVKNQKYIRMIAHDFLKNVLQDKEEIILGGFNAYNTYLTTIVQDPQLNKKDPSLPTRMKELYVDPTVCELISVRYLKNVVDVYRYLASQVPDMKKLTLAEYRPFFQYTQNSCVISYDGEAVVKIFSADGFCVPYVIINGDTYCVTYQYLLMTLNMEYIYAHSHLLMRSGDGSRKMEVDPVAKHNKDLYRKAKINLANMRTWYLNAKNLDIINDTIFSEFITQCNGEPLSFTKETSKRREKRKAMNKPMVYRFIPSNFDGNPEKLQEQLDITISYPNISGNLVNDPRDLLFEVTKGDISLTKRGRMEASDTEDYDPEENHLEPARIVQPKPADFTNPDDINDADSDEDELRDDGVEDLELTPQEDREDNVTELMEEYQEVMNPDADFSHEDTGEHAGFTDADLEELGQ